MNYEHEHCRICGVKKKDSFYDRDAFAFVNGLLNRKHWSGYKIHHCLSQVSMCYECATVLVAFNALESRVIKIIHDESEKVLVKPTFILFNRHDRKTRKQSLNVRNNLNSMVRRWVRDNPEHYELLIKEAIIDEL